MRPPANGCAPTSSAYLTFVAEHSAGFVTLLRGGIGSDPEVAAGRSTRPARPSSGTCSTASAVEHAGPPLEVALHGWVGFVESASLRWLSVPDEGAPTADALVDLFSRQLVTTLDVTGEPARA